MPDFEDDVEIPIEEHILRMSSTEPITQRLLDAWSLQARQPSEAQPVADPAQP
jgi:hypothetical protein